MATNSFYQYQYQPYSSDHAVQLEQAAHDMIQLTQPSPKKKKIEVVVERPLLSTPNTLQLKHSLTFINSTWPAAASYLEL